MKNIFKVGLLLCVFLFAAALGFAGGSAERSTNQITVLHSGDSPLPNGSTLFTAGLAAFHEKYPDVKVNLLKIDLSDGSSLTMDAMLAAGNAPNVLLDTMVRTSKYMVPEFALPLDNYITDLKEYRPGVLAPYRVDGKLLALPVPGDGQAMAVNLDMMKEIGYTVPPDWTISDFLTMAQKVKEHFGGKKYATGLFAGNQSGDYLVNQWFSSFGVQFYANGDYSKTTIANGGAKVYQFFQDLIKAGYVPPNPATSVDDDYVLWWAKGDVAATAFFPSWVAPYFKTVQEQGLGNGFNYEFVSFPRAPGVDKVPLYYSNGAFVIHRTGTDADKIAAYLVQVLNSAAIQDGRAIESGVIPNRVDATAMSSDPHVQQVVKLIQLNGIQDVGLTSPRFTPRRSTEYPILQQLFQFKLSPEEAIAQYAKKFDETK